MRKLFISYARENRRDVDQLVAHLGTLGYDTWADTSLRGGQEWWAEILRRIADCDVFIAIISGDALDSTACRNEFDWAVALGKSVLPVAVEPPPSMLPRRFAIRQIVDYSEPGNRAEAALTLGGALATLPPAPPLPESLPEAPATPLSYLTDLVDLVTQPEALSHQQQRQILIELEPSLHSVDPHERRSGADILERYSRRDDLYADVDRTITRFKAATGPEIAPETVVAQSTPTAAAQTGPANETELPKPSPAPITDDFARSADPGARPPAAADSTIEDRPDGISEQDVEGASRLIVLPFTDLNRPTGVAVDTAGTVYVIDGVRVFRTRREGKSRVVKLPAGSSTPTVLPFTNLDFAVDVAVDQAGTVYVADAGQNRVVRLMAGSRTQTVLPCEDPRGVAVDPTGAVYVLEQKNRRVLKLAAGSSNWTVLPFTDLFNPNSVAVDADGTVYVADFSNDRVVKLPAGSNTQSVLPFTALRCPLHVAVDTAGAVYVTARKSNRVRKLAAGSNTSSDFVWLRHANAVAVDAAGTVYLTDSSENRVVKLPAG